MKRIIVFVAVLCLFVSLASAQELKLSQVTTNAGKSAFISGFDITMKFKGGGNLLDITGNNQRARATYLWDLPLSINAGICGGFFKNMAFAGPYVTFTPFSFLSFLEWVGWSGGKPDNPKTEINFFFHDTAVFLSLGSFTLSYVHEKFMEEEVSIPGVTYKMPINNNFEFSIGADYKFSADLKDEPLFHMGMSYFPFQ